MVTVWVPEEEEAGEDAEEVDGRNTLFFN